MKENEIIPFIFDENPVRVVRDEAGEPWFVAKDVCRILGIEWKGAGETGSLAYLDDDEKGISKVYTLGGEQEIATISEAGLYTLIIRSKKPQAKPFRRWVTHEVLPTLRKSGKYSMKASEEDIVAALCANQQNLKNTHRVKIMEIARSLSQMDEAGRRSFLLFYSQLCGIVGGGAEKPASVIADKGVQTFFENRCSFEGDAVTPKTDLYEEYAAYATTHGYAVITRNLFFKLLYQYSGDAGVSQYHQNKDGARVHSLRGVKLN